VNHHGRVLCSQQYSGPTALVPRGTPREEMPKHPTVPPAIRRLRARAGYSQASFADVVDVHRTYVGAVERREVNISLDNTQRIARALRLTVARLFIEAELDRQAEIRLHRAQRAPLPLYSFSVSSGNSPCGTCSGSTCTVFPLLPADRLPVVLGGDGAAAFAAGDQA
jgi:DNA-binding XRE family transcriptional regulator